MSFSFAHFFRPPPTIASAVPAAPQGRGDLLASIRDGKALRKVNDKEKKYSETDPVKQAQKEKEAKSSPAAAASNPMMAAILNAKLKKT